MTTAKQIRNHIQAIPEGEPFTVAGLLGYGSRASVDKALSRMVLGGQIARVARGVYVCPKQNPYVGAVMPEPIKVAQAVAESTSSTIEVHGAEAARRLGLTTQTPSQPVFWTSGPTRHLHMGKLKLTLKHVAPYKLTLAGTLAGLAVAALLYMGKEQVTPQVLQTIQQKLPAVEFEALQTAASQLPAWVGKALGAYA